jgi:hypothetical protein
VYTGKRAELILELELAEDARRRPQVVERHAQHIRLFVSRPLVVDSSSKSFRSQNMMIDVNKNKEKEAPRLGDYDAGEAPPSYDSIDAGRGRIRPTAGPSSSSNSRQPSFLSSLLGFSSYASSSRPASAPVSSGSRPQSFVPTAASQSDVRATMSELIRDVVQRASRTEAADGLLHSCANACEAHQLSLAHILQERTIEGHSPVYWAITMRPSGRQAGKDVYTEDDAFIMTILKRAMPLAPEAISELRSACLAVSDNVLYRRIRALPGAFPVLGKDRMLLQSLSRDEPQAPGLDEMNERTKQNDVIGGFDDIAEVFEGLSSDDAFYVAIEINMFQRRMRVSNSISIEFINRGEQLYGPPMI